MHVRTCQRLYPASDEADDGAYEYGMGSDLKR